MECLFCPDPSSKFIGPFGLLVLHAVEQHEDSITMGDMKNVIRAGDALRLTLKQHMDVSAVEVKPEVANNVSPVVRLEDIMKVKHSQQQMEMEEEAVDPSEMCVQEMEMDEEGGDDCKICGKVFALKSSVAR